MFTHTAALVLLGLTAPSSPAEEPTDFCPSKAQLVRYLEGKQITAAADAGNPKAGKQGLLIPKGGVVAVEFSASALSGPERVDRPKPRWETGVIFIVEKGGKRYAVEGQVSHLRVGSDRAFFGFTVWSITKQ